MNLINKIINIKEKNKKKLEIVNLPIDKIIPSAYQTRKNFDEKELNKLTQSIIQNGLLQPVVVRVYGFDNFELIAGERRLKACKLAGMSEIPAIVHNFENDNFVALCLLLNTQRQELNCFETANALKDIINFYNITNAQAAEKLGILQSDIESYLRILSLSKLQIDMCLQANLSLEHVSEILRLVSESERTELLKLVINKEYSAQKTKEIVNAYLLKDTKQKQKIMVRDVRIFINTITNAVKLMTDNGIPATAQQKEQNEYIEYTVRIPVSAHENPITNYKSTSENIEQIRLDLISEIDKQVSSLQSV